jgi:hypothetical protein
MAARKHTSTIGMALAVCLIVAAPTEGNAPKLHSPEWLRRHCPISVRVNFEAAGFKYMSKSGVTLRVTRPKVADPQGEIAKYTWHISSSDQFCGIVGASHGPKYLSLMPTSLSRRGGEYIDHSLTGPEYLAIREFFLYARHR